MKIAQKESCNGILYSIDGLGYIDPPLHAGSAFFASYRIV